MKTLRVCIFILAFCGLPRPDVRAGYADRGDGASRPGVAELRTETGGDSGTTISQILKQVMEANPRIRAASAREQSYRARIPQASAWDDPQAGVEFYATPVNSLNPLADGMETDYFLQQMIPFPGKKGAMADAAAAEANMAGQAARWTERDVVAATKRAFAMLYSAQRRLAVNNQNRLLLEQIISSARAKYSVGIGTQADVLKLQVELSRLQNENSTLEQETVSSAAMLNALMNRAAGTPIGALAADIPDSLATPVDTLLARALSSRPDLVGMKFGIEMSRAELSASTKEWLPDFMLKGTYKQMREQKDQWAAMVGISLPLSPWGIGKYSGKVEENEAKLSESIVSFGNMENMVRSEVLDAFAKVQSRWTQADRYRTSILPQAEQSLEATLASYRIDKVDFLSVLDSYRMVGMFRMEYYMVVGEYLANRALLEQAVGSDIN